MIALKIKVNQVSFEHRNEDAQITLFLNSILYCTLTVGQHKYLCINMKVDQIEMEVDVRDNVHLVEIRNIIFDGYLGRREESLLQFGEGKQGTISLEITRLDGIPESHRIKQSISESKSEYSLNTIMKTVNNNQSIEKNSEILQEDAFSELTNNQINEIEKSPNLIKEASNTTFETNKQNEENIKTSYEFDPKTSLNELAQQRERIIQQLFSKLKIQSRS